MIYLTSDLHGDLQNFIHLLSKIRFNKEVDHLYILGDILDRNGGLELLEYISVYLSEGSMTLIKGNHELFAEMYLQNNLGPNTWERWGGKQTRQDIDNLSQHEKSELLDFIKRLPYYINLDSQYGKTILTHSGLDADVIVWNDDTKVDVEASIMEAVRQNEFKMLVSNDLHYLPANVIKNLDSYLFVGHVPVMHLTKGSNKILHKNKYTCIDTGAGHRSEGGKMSVLCMDDGKEYYI